MLHPRFSYFVYKNLYFTCRKIYCWSFLEIWWKYWHFSLNILHLTYTAWFFIRLSSICCIHCWRFSLQVSLVCNVLLCISITESDRLSLIWPKHGLCDFKPRHICSWRSLEFTGCLSFDYYILEWDLEAARSHICFIWCTAWCIILYECWFHSNICWLWDTATAWEDCWGSEWRSTLYRIAVFPLFLCVWNDCLLERHVELCRNLGR